jgi:hypothetical protein
MSRPDGITPDVVERLVQGDVRAAFAERDHELDLVMHVRGFGRVGELPVVRSASGFFWKKKGGSRLGSWPISIACSA